MIENISIPMNESLLVVGTNRLPMELKVENNKITSKPTIGGLKTSVERAMQNGPYRGIWVGSTELTQEEMEGLDEALGPDTNGNHTDYAFVNIPPEIYDRYYLHDANGQKWMYFHRLKEHASLYADENYDASRTVNKMFADEMAKFQGDGAIAWPQDYHLPYVGEELERLGVRMDTMHFSHIPMQDAAYLSDMPRIREYINALLRYGLTSFQDPRFLRNFIECVQAFGDYEEIKAIDEGVLIKSDGKYTLAAAYPIGVDPEDYDQIANDIEVQEREAYHRKDLPTEGVLFGGLSRDELAKNVFGFLEGFEHALDTNPDMRGVLFYDRVIAQGRDLPAYKENRRRIDEKATEINTRYEQYYKNRPPVRILPKVQKPGAVGLLKAVDVIEAASLQDGRNLTGDEGTLVNERDAVLLVGADTGARGNLGDDSVIVDSKRGKEHMAERIVFAATLHPDIRRIQSQNRNRIVRGNTVFHWTENNIRGMQIVKEINKQLSA